MNLLKLAYLSDRFGELEFGLNFKRGIVTLDGINFGLTDIEPFVIVETFGLRIHDKVNASRGMTILDAGACFGDTALHFSQMGCRVYAIEPDPVNYAAMNRNLQLNPDLAGRIVTADVALGNNEVLDFAYNEGGVYGGASAYVKKGKTKKIQSYTLGKLLDKLGLGTVDVLKMDCKGAEDYLTTEDLKRVKYCAKIEYMNKDRSGKALKNLINAMAEAGLKPGAPYKHNADSSPIELVGTLIGFRE